MSDAGGLYFFYGGGVDWSFFFQVFSFEVSSDPFAGIGSCGWEEINFFEFVTLRFQHIFYLFEIIGVVGGYSY